MMIIRVPQYRIRIDQLINDHGLIDYKWLFEDKKYRELINTITGKDLGYE